MIGLIKLLRLLSGYIAFEVWGGFPERFLNLCKLRGVNLYSAEIDGDKISAITDIRGFTYIEEISKRSGMSVNIKAKRGLPFFLKRHKYRCGVLVGIGIVISFIAFMSGFVWQVEVVGEDKEKNAQIEESLRDLGVHNGVRKSKIDILEVQEKMLLVRDDITWISINIFGTKAKVEYTPAKEKIPITDTSAPINVVAEKRGRITLVECYGGTKMVKEGDYVIPGDLLISGVTANLDGSESITHASGKVFARTENEYEYKCNLEYSGYVTETSDTSYSINLFGLRIPIGKGVKEEYKSEVCMNIRGNDTELPVGLVRFDGFSCGKRKITLTEHQAELLCVSKATTEKRQSYGDAQVEKETFVVEKKDNVFVLKQTVICVENIAKEEEFYVEKN